ncbi:hypothetical protein [Companilactobacillus heilongjiangensis]|uniref:Uncharacterized protein n=1 Tax=Companilactobacillus heilongjiangensis TaxID=1074467 RepID=A0A0K2LAK2_9LACO|nr:hypothetical protein [Companilactobacillus heilongjiangensis]ALB28337.1 hypothetical protein JP39_02470 [Companilactobacillus heilongjiangensis]
MKKKMLIVAILSFVSAGLFLVFYSLVKFLKNKKINDERKKLEDYVEKYLHGNEKIMQFIGTLSDDQVKELLDILMKIQKEQDQLKLKSPIFPKYLEKKVTNLIG